MPKHSPSSLNPRSPLVLDTRDLPRRPGALRTVKRVVPAPEDLGVELIGVPQGADLDLDLRLESVSEGVLVSGTVTGSGPFEVSSSRVSFGRTGSCCGWAEMTLPSGTVSL